MEFEGGDPLSNLTLFDNSFEPSGCSVGNEVYTTIDSRTVRLSHLLIACTAEISLAAQVHTQSDSIFSALHDNKCIFFAAARYKCSVWRQCHHSHFIR